MAESKSYPYTPVKSLYGEVSLRPLLPIILKYRGQSYSIDGLLDTGADVNVLPFHVGIKLGAVWEEQTTSVLLSGNLANYEARGIIVEAHIGELAPTQLAFAWTQAERVPLILGQVNFFMEFNACFYRSGDFFEIFPENT